jgi:DNA-binding protein YbaB
VNRPQRTNQDLHARYDYLVREYERTRRGLQALRERLSALRATAESKDGMVTVTVGPRGEVEAVELNPRAYRRLTPAELAASILDTIRQAGRSLSDQAAEAYGPYLPAGTSYPDLLTGEVDLSAFVPEQPVTDATFDQWWERWRGTGMRP